MLVKELMNFLSEKDPESPVIAINEESSPLNESGDEISVAYEMDASNESKKLIFLAYQEEQMESVENRMVIDSEWESIERNRSVENEDDWYDDTDCDYQEEIWQEN